MWTLVIVAMLAGHPTKMAFVDGFDSETACKDFRDGVMRQPGAHQVTALKCERSLEV